MNYNTYSLIEKKDIRRHSNCISCALLMCELIVVLLSLGVTLVFSLMSLNIRSLNEDLIVSNIYNAAVMSVALTFPFVLTSFTLGSKKAIKTVFVKPRTSLYITVLYCGFALMLSFAAGMITNLISSFFEIFAGVEPYAPTGGTSYSTPAPAVAFDILCSCLLPAMYEEFAFRGVILNTFRRFGDQPAIIITSLLFGLLHGNFVQIPYTIIMGIGLSFITIRTGSIYPAIAVHFTNNLLATIAEWFPTPGNILTLILIVLCVLAAAMLMKRGGLVQSPDVPSFFSKSKRVQLMLTSPFMIIYIILQIVASFTYLH